MSQTVAVVLYLALDLHYLAAHLFVFSGVLGLLDYDAVEINNLHRQILHCEGRVGIAKTDSAKLSITR